MISVRKELKRSAWRIFTFERCSSMLQWWLCSVLIMSRRLPRPPKIFFRRQPSEFLFFLWYHLLSFTPQRLVSRQVLTTTAAQLSKQAAAQNGGLVACQIILWHVFLWIEEPTFKHSLLTWLLYKIASRNHSHFTARFLSILPHLPECLSAHHHGF